MQIGAHISSAGGIDKAIDRAVELGADSVQVFTQSPRAWRPTNHDPASFERFREKRAEAGIGGVVCHALYLCNLAAPDDTVYEKSVAAMRNTMEVACEIGADGVVFHVGSHLGSGLDAGLERVVPAMEQVLELCSDETWLLMENSAGAGGTIGRSVEELATIWESLDRHPRLGVCLDSCHLWVSGVDVTDPAALDACLDELDSSIERPIVPPAPAEFSISSQVSSEQSSSTRSIAGTTRSSPASRPLPRCEPTWKTTPSAPMAQPTSIVFRIAATEFS